MSNVHQPDWFSKNATCDFYSITAELINELHWLPIKQCIDNTIFALVYKALLGQAPSDVTDMLQITTHRQLRSSCSDGTTLVEPRSLQGLGVLPLLTEPFLPMHQDCGTDCLITLKIVLSNTSRNSWRATFSKMLTSSRFELECR